MLLEALLVDCLLGDDVAGAEEDGRGDDLGQQWPLDQLGLVPTVKGLLLAAMFMHEAEWEGEVLTI